MALSAGTVSLTVKPDTKGFGSKLSQGIMSESGSLSSTGKGLSTLLLGGLAGAGAAVGAKAAGAIGGAFASAGHAVFDFNSVLQNATIGFTTMLGSGQKAQTFLDQLQGFAKATPFEFQGLVQNSQTMLGMGVAAKDIIPDLTALGDSVASVGGSGDQLNNVILAFSQTMAKGTLDMGNMNQLLQGGVPNALKILAAQYKVTTGEMVKMISSGKVQSSEALPLLVQGLEKGTSATAALGGMMDKQSTTMTGALSNIGDASTQLLAKAFKPLFDVASSGAQKLAAILSSPQLTNFGNAISSGLSTAFAGISSAFTGFVSGFTKGTDAIGSSQSVFARWGAVAYGAFDMVRRLAAPVIASIGAAFRQVWPALAPVIGQFVQLAVTISPVHIILQALLPVLPQLVGMLGSLAAMVAGVFATSLRTLLPAITQVVGVLVTGLMQAVRQLVPYLMNLVSVMGPILGAVIRALVPIIVMAAQFFGQLLQMVVPLIPVVLSLFQALQPLLTQLIQLIGPILVPLIGLLAAVLRPILQLAAAIISVLVPIITGLVRLLGFVLPPVIRVVIGLFGAIAGIAVSVFGPAIRGVSSILSGLINFVAGVFTGNWRRAWQGITEIVGGVFSGIGGIVKAALNLVIDSINGAIGGINTIGGAVGIHVGTIPHLAEGGTVLPRPGGTLAVLGEAGKSESVVDTGKLNRLIDQATNSPRREMPNVTIHEATNANQVMQLLNVRLRSLEI